MSGELIVKGGGGKKTALSLILTAALVILVMMPMARVLQTNLQTGMLTQIGIAILVPILIWLLYPQMAKLLPGGKDGGKQTLRWSIQNQTLTLGDTEIPLSEIKMVYCWKKNDGWTVNIETTGKNVLLRSLDEGAEAERSAQRLYDLVEALGYRAQWKE